MKYYITRFRQMFEMIFSTDVFLVDSLVDIERLLMAILYQFVDVFSTWTTSSSSVVEFNTFYIINYSEYS